MQRESKSYISRAIDTGNAKVSPDVQVCALHLVYLRHVIGRPAEVAAPARAPVGRRPVHVRVDVGAALVASNHADFAKVH